MRPGGREIDGVETRAPGHLDFVPNQPEQHPRTLDAKSMVMTYGANNQIQSFHATDVQTQTEPNAEERAKKQPVAKTHSQYLSAEFDPKTGDMKRMEQRENFLYEAGDRRARAKKASLDSDRNLMILETGARLWDSTGTTSAERIRIDQKSGDFAAEGHVSSSRQADKKNSPSAMLSGDEPVEAMADHMTSANHNHLLHYDGHSVLWQGGDRITADSVEIDRDSRRLKASGNVMTQFLEKKHAEPGPVSSQTWGDAAQAPEGQGEAPVFVIVRAASLVYTDQDRLAHYSGEVHLERPGLQVKADELRAILSEQKKDSEQNKEKTKDETEAQSRLEKAFADGHVEIVQTGADRTRTGTSDHAEYYTQDEHIILKGGQPQMVDSKKGYTRGTQLTYYVNDGRLLVSGTAQQRATSRLRRK